MSSQTKHEIEDQYFPEFLRWCAHYPEGSMPDGLFWLDYHYPTSDNFWEWIIKYKSDVVV